MRTYRRVEMFKDITCSAVGGHEVFRTLQFFSVGLILPALL